MIKKVTSNKRYELQTLADLGPLEFITSGIDEIDKLTKIPRARITEIYGLRGVGKTTLVSHCIAKMSQEGKVLYIDAENALNPDRMKEIGANTDNVDITDTHILEEVAELTIDNFDKYDVVIVDSIASLVPKSEYEGQTGDQFIGLKARLMGQWMRKITGKLGKSKCALVFINQIRESPNMYVPRFTPGGHAVPYAASLRLELSSNKSDVQREKGTATGQTVNVEITKSKVCKPYQKTSFTLEY